MAAILQVNKPKFCFLKSYYMNSDSLNYGISGTHPTLGNRGLS